MARLPNWRAIKLDIPEGLNKTERQILADLIIEHIKTRTEQGQGGKMVDGRFVPKNLNSVPYSESYIKSLDFKIAGKKKGLVNLTLSGDMLASIEKLNDTPTSITVGFSTSEDPEVLGRAEGNHKGSYGGSENSSKARPFLGISKADIMRYVKEVRRG